jgi:hypothetical protein
MRRIRGGGFDLVASLLEKSYDVGRAAQFTTKVEADVFVRDRSAVSENPTIKKINWRGFGAKAFTIQSARIVINNKTITCLTIEASEATDTVGVGAALHHKTKINRNALVANGSTTRGGGAMVSLVEFGLKANWALVKFRSNRDLRDAGGILVEVRNATTMEVAEALMP